LVFATEFGFEMNQYTETVPADFLDGFDVTEEEDEENSPKEDVCWGRVFPLGSSFIAMGKLLSDN